MHVADVDLEAREIISEKYAYKTSRKHKEKLHMNATLSFTYMHCKEKSKRE